MPDDKKPEEVTVEKLNLKLLYEKFRGTKLNSLLSSPFLCTLAIYLGSKEDISKNFKTRIYKNLFLKVLSSKENSCPLVLDALTEVSAEIGSHLASGISSNYKRKMEENMKQEMKISEKYDFYEDGANQ